MTLGMEHGIRRYRYGGISLWVLRNSLGGSRARRLREKIGLHFEESRTPLALDLRELSHLDSVGAGMLEDARFTHSDLSLVGRPRDYHELPLSIRGSLDILRPARSLEAVLGMQGGAASAPKEGGVQRLHHRVPVQIPVEIFLDDMSAAATLCDISLGGSRIGPLPGEWLGKMEKDRQPEIFIVGMGLDPLGREITGRYRTNTVASRPVHVIPDSSGMGVKFFRTLS